MNFSLRLKAEQLLLVLHDQVVGALGIFAIVLVVLGCVGPCSFLVDGEIAVMHLRGVGFEIHVLKQSAILRLGRGLAIFFFKHYGILSFDLSAVRSVAAISFDNVNEKQAQHLDALRREAKLLVQMLLDRAPNHDPFKRLVVNVAERFAEA